MQMTISQKSSQQTHEAIVFFAGDRISKEMLYTEFEALLDCVVPMREFTGRDIQAAYVRLDGGLTPAAVVLFMVRFDADGFPDQSWNVPLRNLAENGVRGQDLGAGPVRLATRSQCGVPGQEENLWDIQFGSEGNTLELLRDRLRINRLGIDAVDLHPPAQSWATQPAPAAVPVSQSLPQQAAAQAGADSADAVRALMQQNQQQMAILKEQNQREVRGLQERLTELQQRLRALDGEKLQLQQQLETNTRAAADDRSRAELTLQMAVERARGQAATLRHELEEQHAAAVSALQLQYQQERSALEQHFNEQLAGQDTRTREAVARGEREHQQQEEQLHSLRTELTDLRRDRLRLMGEGAGKFFDALKEKGVKFVAFQPGAGHLTIAMEDLSRFIDDTEQFVAEKCGVSLEHYRRWLAHYNDPVCQGSAGHGGQCSKPLTKLLKPAEFVAGMHDRCDVHKQVPRSRPAPERAP
jgi:hypothetical protein